MTQDKRGRAYVLSPVLRRNNMKCWECKRKVRRAWSVCYLAVNSSGEGYAEKYRDVCDDCYPKLQFNPCHYAEINKLSQRQTKKEVKRMKKQEKGSFSAWMIRNFSVEERQDIAKRGCAGGFHHLTYYADTVKLHDRFEDEIWDRLYEVAEDQGINIMQLIASFNGAKNVGNLTQLKNLLTWHIAEETARTLELTESE